MNNMPRLMMAMAGLMLTTGCPPKDIDVDVDEDKLTGLSYVLESAEGYTLVEESNFMLSFSESAQGETYFSASTGCNSIDGIYSIDDGVMNVDMMSTTDMWCSDELSTQEDWLLEFFHSLLEFGDRADLIRLRLLRRTSHATRLEQPQRLLKPLIPQRVEPRLANA